MTVQSDEQIIADYLEMTRKTTDSDIEKIFSSMLTERDLIEVPNESVDAEQFLNENRRPNPYAQRISDLLKKF